MNKLKHFLIFAIISFLLVFLQNFIGRNTNPGDKLLQTLNIIAVLEIPLLITIMIRTYKSNVRLKFKEKLLFLIGIEFTMLVSAFLINLINPFGRNIFMEDIYSGMINTSIMFILIFFLSLPILIFVQSKLTT